MFLPDRMCDLFLFFSSENNNGLVKHGLQPKLSSVWLSCWSIHSKIWRASCLEMITQFWYMQLLGISLWEQGKLLLVWVAVHIRGEKAWFGFAKEGCCVVWALIGCKRKGKELKVNAMASFKEKKRNKKRNQATIAWCKRLRHLHTICCFFRAPAFFMPEAASVYPPRWLDPKSNWHAKDFYMPVAASGWLGTMVLA